MRVDHPSGRPRACCAAAIALSLAACVAPRPQAAFARVAAPARGPAGGTNGSPHAGDARRAAAAPSGPTSVDPRARPTGAAVAATTHTGLGLQTDAEQRRGFWERAFDVVSRDYAHFYDAGTLLALGAGVGVAGVAANSDFDTEVRSAVQESWRTPFLDDVRDNVSWSGDVEVMVPAMGLVTWLGPKFGSDAVGTWGERTLRAYAVAAPMTLALQRITGGRRPDDPGNAHGSEWRFLDGSHGVSGHAVASSIPFLTIAKLQDDPWIDALCYAASTVVGLARLQDDRHYASQVALGWWIGYLTSEAVDDTERGEAPAATSWMPVIAPGHLGVVVSHRL